MGILLRQLMLLWESPYGALCLAISCYALISVAVTQRTIFRPSNVAYFNYLADSFLHGQLALRLIPQTTHDLVFWGREYFLYWPPLPGVIFMPFVALFGIDVSDIIINIAIASGNVGLVANLLRRAAKQEMVVLSPMQRGALVLFFALGTVHLTLAPFGRVWSTSQLLGFQFILIAYVIAMGRNDRLNFALTGLALAGTLLTRTHMIFAGIWPVAHLVQKYLASKNGRLWPSLLLLTTPVAAAVLLLATYNWLRFGDPFENGLSHHLLASEFANEFQRYGVFSLHYVPKNIFYQFIAYPFPLTEESFQGGSLFLLSPVFLGALWGWAPSPQRFSVWLLVVSMVLVLVPILTLMGTGWIQFGPRYLLDITVPLLLLTAGGIQRWPPQIFYVLIFLSIEQYVVGTVLLGRYLISLNNL